MSRTLTTYFSLVSPWSYLGHAALVDIARRHEASIVFKPMDLGRLFPESGGLPLAKRHPSRQAYRDIELQRWREARGIPLKLRPAFWPFRAALADQVVVALIADGADPDPFIRRAFAGIWAEDRNFADEATLADCLVASGFDAAVLARAKSSEIAAAYVRNTKDALAAGVFGAQRPFLTASHSGDRIGSIFWIRPLPAGATPTRREARMAQRRKRHWLRNKNLLCGVSTFERPELAPPSKHHRRGFLFAGSEAADRLPIFQ